MSTNLSIKYRSFQAPKPVSTALQQKIKKAQQQTSSTPVKPVGEVFTPSSPAALKKARPGSDMDIMVNDLKATGAIKEQPQSEPIRKKPREGSDMADMLANIDKQKNNLENTEVHVSSTGAIAVLEDPVLPQKSLQTKGAESSERRPGGDRADDAMSGGGVAIEGIEQAGSEATSGLAEVAGEVAEQGAQLATQSFGKMAMETALQAGSVLSGALVAPLLWRGGKKLAEGIKEKDLDKKLDGANNIGIGARSAATAVTMSNIAGGGSSAMGVVGEVAKVAAPALGVATAAVDGVLGVREIAKGKDKVGGLLRIGFAIGVGAAALGAGPIATVATGGFLAARVGRAVHKFQKNRKAAKQAAQEAKQSA